jgi:uncharacterized protein (TIGR00730 family)
MRRICVFCGSSMGRKRVYAQTAASLGALLARHGIALVYGGGSIGLMGVIADTLLAAGGHVIGVIPRALATRELLHTGLPDLRVVGSMHERKALMAELADAFVALPGGIGTFEEFLEVLTWAQLGMHRKPCGLLNVEGYFDSLMTFLDHAVSEGFFRPEHRRLVLDADDPERLIERLASYRPPVLERWIDPTTT